jgi:hypothetical protein
MKSTFAVWFSCVLLLAPGRAADDAPKAPAAAAAAVDTPEMVNARAAGVTALQLMDERLRKYSTTRNLPGVKAWVETQSKPLSALKVEKPDPSWRQLDGDKLITHNPVFWQLYYDVVPGDPGLAMLHAGALLAAGDAHRAQIILRLTLHRGDLDADAQTILTSMLRAAAQFMRPPNELVRKGIALYDAGDFDGAMKEYDAAVRLWPLDGWAAYERGLTLRTRDKETGEEASQKIFTECRRIAPFQWAAWQGAVDHVPGMVVMHKVVRPLWEKSSKSIDYVMTTEELKQFSEALQEAEVDDLALVARQILIVRNGRYSPEDHPFISKSLRRLVRGPKAEGTLQRLSGESMATIQLYAAPVPGKKE